MDVGNGDRFDPGENRALGRAYLARLYHRYANWVDAVAAYNWGPGHMDAWIDSGRPIDKFPETVALYRVRVLYGGGAVTPGHHIQPRRPLADLHAIAEGKTAGRTKTGRWAGARKGGKGTATRTVGLLGAIFTYAVRQGLRTDNPVHGVMRYADGQRERRLNAGLGKALRTAEAEGKIWPAAIAMARFLALTGWRSGEAQALRWTEFDLVRRTARLADTKTRLSIRPLSYAACDVLRTMQRRSSDRVFPATRGDGPMVGFKKFWPKIAKLGGVREDITPHVWRHSFASLAGDLGYSEPTTAALVGHKGHSITSRYVHAADAVLLAAADAVE
jgi:integrase